MKYMLMLILGALLALGQQQRMPTNSRQSANSTGGRVPGGAQGPDVLVDFKGTASIVTTKKITVTPEDTKAGEDANTMDFEITRKTVVLSGDKKLKVTDLKPGDQLAVESKRLIDGTLEAVTVRKTL